MRIEVKENECNSVHYLASNEYFLSDGMQLILSTIIKSSPLSLFLSECHCLPGNLTEWFGIIKLWFTWLE